MDVMQSEAMGEMPTVSVLDSEMYFVATPGKGVPIVFLHGNPTSSYLWRRVLPLAAEQFAGGEARCLAPDLIGMGRSGKPPIEYRFADHARYLDAWCDAVGLEEIAFVGHDWGGALAFDWARRHPERIRGIAFLETIVKPMSWEEFPEGARQAFVALRFSHQVDPAIRRRRGQPGRHADIAQDPWLGAEPR